MTPEELSADLAARIAGSPAPSDEVLALAERHFLETVAVALAGSREPVVRAALDTMAAAADGGVRSLVSDRRLSRRDAAVCNGTAGHAHDYDDDEPHVIVGHPSVVVVAALLAMADGRPLSFARALHGYAAGVETMSSLGALVNPRHYNDGWHCTSTLGVFGAVAACGVAMRMAPDRIEHALAIAATLSGGLKENFGSDLKPLQVGMAAGNAVWACELAAAGVQGSRSAIFGSRGFVALLGSAAPARAGGFGPRWAVETPGINVKVYPCCSSTHTAIDAMLALRPAPGRGWEDVAAVDVWIGEDVPGILVHDVPASGLQGKFSMRYCLAVALVKGRVALDDFTDEAVRDPLVLDALRRVRVHVDRQLPRAATGVTHRSRVRLTMRDGGQAEREVDAPLGSADRPCSAQRLGDKALECVSFVHGAEAAGRIVRALGDVRRSDPLARLLDAVHSGVR